MDKMFWVKRLTVFLFAILMFAASPQILHAEEMEIETTDYITGEVSIDYISAFDEDSTFPFTPGFYGDISNSYSPNAIIDPDERIIVEDTTRVPYRYIGKLYYEDQNGISHGAGTGFLVGQNIVLTAAHCVYHKGDTIKSMTFVPGLNGTTKPYGVYSVSKSHVPKQYKTEKESLQTDTYSEILQKYDYAVLELNGNAGLKLGYFGLGGYSSAYNKDNLVGKLVTVAGYPENAIHKTKLYKHKAAIDSFNSDGYLMWYANDTESGQSGSPVIYPINGRYYVVGIHVATHSKSLNQGRYVTKNVFTLVNKYR